VNYILGQITRKMAAFIEKKKKINVNQNTIEQLILFLRCDIENPAFNSQTKDYMNTPSSGFGSTCSVSDSFIENLEDGRGGCVFADGVEGLQQDRQEDGRVEDQERSWHSKFHRCEQRRNGEVERVYADPL
jgi:DNA gyrase/topoisomerase IV subunit B